MFNGENCKESKLVLFNEVCRRGVLLELKEFNSALEVLGWIYGHRELVESMVLPPKDCSDTAFIDWSEGFIREYLTEEFVRYYVLKYLLPSVSSLELIEGTYVELFKKHLVGIHPHQGLDNRREFLKLFKNIVYKTTEDGEDYESY